MEETTKEELKAGAIALLMIVLVISLLANGAQFYSDKRAKAAQEQEAAKQVSVQQGALQTVYNIVTTVQKNKEIQLPVFAQDTSTCAKTIEGNTYIDAECQKNAPWKQTGTITLIEKPNVTKR